MLSTDIRLKNRPSVPTYVVKSTRVCGAACCHNDARMESLADILLYGIYTCTRSNSHQCHGQTSQADVAVGRVEYQQEQSHGTPRCHRSAPGEPARQQSDTPSPHCYAPTPHPRSGQSKKELRPPSTGRLCTNTTKHCQISTRAAKPHVDPTCADV